MTLHVIRDRCLHRGALRCDRADRAADARCAHRQKTYNVALVEEELGEVGTILAGDTGDEGDLGFGHG